MKIGPFTLSFGKAETKESSAGRIISGYSVGRPVWSKRNFAQFSEEAYLRNAVASYCVKLIASSAASVPLILRNNNGEEIERHPLIDLLARPNPMNSGTALFEAYYAYRLLAGNSYIEAVGPEGRPPTELWYLRPDRMSVIPGASGIPSAYEYRTESGRIRWDVDSVSGTSPILHSKEFHPTDDWYGMSRMEPASYGVDRHNAASAHNKALLDNGARPSGALVFEPVRQSSGAEAPPPPEVVNAAAKDLDDHTGARNAGRPFVFGGNVKWLEMGISPRDMDFSGGKDDAARDICTSMGVPHILVVPGQSTYNNLKEARLEFWETTVLSLVGDGVGELNNWLVPKFDESVTLESDLDGVPALEPRRESKRASTMKLLETGVIDSDEARAALQYGPRSENSVKKFDAAILSSLINGVDKMGYVPLIRYAKSVGLYDPGMSDDELMALTAGLVVEDDEAELLVPEPTVTQTDE